MLDPLLDEIPDPEPDVGTHRASNEILVTIFATKIAILRRHQDQLESICPIMLGPESNLKLPIFVYSFSDQKPAVDEVLDAAFVPGFDAAQRLLHERDLSAAKDADGVAQGIPKDESAVFSGGADVVARRLPSTGP